MQKHYSAVSNLDLPKLTYPGEPLTSEELQVRLAFKDPFRTADLSGQRVVFYRTIKNVPQMRLIWPFEDQKPLWQSKVCKLFRQRLCLMLTHFESPVG